MCMPRRFVTCPLCGRGYGSASIDIHIPQCYDKALKRWRIDPIGPRPVMPQMNKSKSIPNKTTFSEGSRFADEQPCGIGSNTTRSLGSNFERDAFPSGNPNLHACSKCGRRFVFDRIGYHEKVCKGDMKRRIFDSSKQRRPEDEPFGSENSKICWGRRTQKKKPEAATSIGIFGEKKPNMWRQQHEELIQAIRSARRHDAKSQQMWGARESDREPLQGFRSGVVAPPRQAGVPASMIRQSATHKSNIALGGRAERQGPSFPPPSSTADAFRAPARNQNGRGTFPSAISRGDSHRFTAGGGSGSGGIRIANDNTTSLGMLQAFGRA